MLFFDCLSESSAFRWQIPQRCSLVGYAVIYARQTGFVPGALPDSLVRRSEASKLLLRRWRVSATVSAHNANATVCRRFVALGQTKLRLLSEGE